VSKQNRCRDRSIDREIDRGIEIEIDAEIDAMQIDAMMQIERLIAPVNL